MTAVDPLYRLTVAELDAASRLLKTDIVTAIANDTMNRWAGLAIVAFLLAKREDPSAALTTFRNMTMSEITTALGLDVETVEIDTDPDADPDEAEPAGELPADDPLYAALAEDPTAPSPA